MLSLTGKRWLETSATIQNGSDTFVRQCTDNRALLWQGLQPSPFLFPDMEKACMRIQAAIRTGERIGIFGDYDCDGITATAQLVRFFRRYDMEPIVRLPHRLRDGYGLKRAIVDELITQKISLLITVDTGISSAEEIAYATNNGIDVLVTDHHHLPAALPRHAVALIHPALAPHYPLPHPSGAGVVYHLIRALEGEHWDDCCTDTALAAIGTVGDLVELRGPNRALVENGLECLYELADSPLAALRSNCVQAGKMPSSRDVGFGIAPRINAAGRMDDPMIALRALLDGGEDLMVLEELNRQRQEETRALTKEAVAVVQQNAGKPLIAIAHGAYPPGIIGLIAGRLTEQFGKPSCIATIDGEMCTASLRSIPEYNIIKGLELCSDLLLSFGGHAQAAGCTFLHANFEHLTQRLQEHIHMTVTPDALQPTIVVDAILQPSDITLAFAKQVRTLEPFGQGNSEPRFVLRNIVLGALRQVGKDSSHLQGMIGSTKIVGFGLGGLMEKLNCPTDVLCRIGVDTWNGRESVQLFIDDIRVSERVAVSPK